MNDPMMVDQCGIKLRQMCCVFISGVPYPSGSCVSVGSGIWLHVCALALPLPLSALLYSSTSFPAAAGVSGGRALRRVRLYASE